MVRSNYVFFWRFSIFVFVFLSIASEFHAQSNAPTLSAISPPNVGAGAPATTITITGNGFVSGSVVSANTSSLTTTFINTSTLEAIIPAALLNTPSTLQISVRNSNSPVSNSLSFYVVSLSPPTMTGISPAAGLSGTAVSVTITGTNLIGATVQVSGDGVIPTINGGTDTSLQVTFSINAGASTGPRSVTLTTPVGTTPACSRFFANLQGQNCTFWITVGGSWRNLADPPVPYQGIFGHTTQ